MILNQNRLNGYSTKKISLEVFNNATIEELDKLNPIYEPEELYSIILSRAGESLALHWFNSGDDYKQRASIKWFVRNLYSFYPRDWSKLPVDVKQFLIDYVLINDPGELYNSMLKARRRVLILFCPYTLPYVPSANIKKTIIPSV